MPGSFWNKNFLGLPWWCPAGVIKCSYCSGNALLGSSQCLQVFSQWISLLIKAVVTSWIPQIREYCNSLSRNLEREADPCKLLLTDATVELSLDNTQNNQKKEVAKPSSPLPSLDVAASSSRNLSKSYEEVRIPNCPWQEPLCVLSCKHES